MWREVVGATSPCGLESLPDRCFHIRAADGSLTQEK